MTAACISISITMKLGYDEFEYYKHYGKDK